MQALVVSPHSASAAVASRGRLSSERCRSTTRNLRLPQAEYSLACRLVRQICYPGGRTSRTPRSQTSPYVRPVSPLGSAQLSAEQTVQPPRSPSQGKLPFPLSEQRSLHLRI